MENIIELGLIKGRHLLPVQNYIIEESELTVFTKEQISPIVKKGIEKYIKKYNVIN